MSKNEEQHALPVGWRWVKLGELCEFQYGTGLIESARQEGTVPVYGSNGIVGYHNASITSGPTIIIGRKGSVGQVHYSTIPCFPIDTTYYIDSVKEPTDLIWLAYMLSVLDLPELNKASGVPGLNRNDAYKQLLPLPPLPEQQRIAALLKEQLAAVDQARLAAQARLEAVKALPAAYLRQVFPQPGQPLPTGWRWVRLKDVSSIISKGTTPTTLGLQYTDTGIPFLRAEDVTGWAVDVNNVTFHISSNSDALLSRSRLLPGDFLVTIAGTLGRIGYVPPETQNLNCNQAVAFARVDQNEVNIQYLCFVGRLDYIISPLINQKAGGALQNLNLQQVGGLKLPLPSLPEQQRIAALLIERFSAVEQARQAAEAELNTINTLPAALLRRAFNGEL